MYLWSVRGAKNSSLPILASLLLLKNNLILKNIPKNSDTFNMIKIIKQFKIKMDFKDYDLHIDCSQKIIPQKINYNECTHFKSSYYIIGALYCSINSYNFKCLDGCKIGERPIDQHIKFFSILGNCKYHESGDIFVKNNNVKDITFKFDIKTVGGTINAILARTVCNYNTILLNCQSDQSINELINFLNFCGAKIFKNNDIIKILGVKELSLNKSEYKITEDHIVTFTYLVFQNLLNKNYKMKYFVENFNYKLIHNIKIIKILKKAGFNIICKNNKYSIKFNENFKNNNILTISFDSDITDSMPFIVLLFVEYGIKSYLIDEIYENRTKSYNHLIEMGYKNLEIVSSNTLKISKNNNNNIFRTIPFKNYDLRGDACNLIANVINNKFRLDFSDKFIFRGYDSLIEISKNISEKIKMIKNIYL